MKGLSGEKKPYLGKYNQTRHRKAHPKPNGASELKSGL